MWLHPPAQIWSCFHIALHLFLLFIHLSAQQGMSILSASHWAVSGTLLTSNKESTITPSWLMGQKLPSLISSQRKNSVSLFWNPGPKLQCSWGEVGAAGVCYNPAETAACHGNAKLFLTLYTYPRVMLIPECMQRGRDCREAKFVCENIQNWLSVLDLLSIASHSYTAQTATFTEEQWLNRSFADGWAMNKYFHCYILPVCPHLECSY